LKKIKLKTL